MIQALLSSGGDERSTADPSSGRNRYGCLMRPDPEVATWSSCTASPPSARAFEAARVSHERVSAQGEELRAELLDLVGLTPDEIEIVFMPSGTDAEFIPLAFLLGEGSTRIANILVAEGELGASTSLAASARHCASTSPSSGESIAKGAAVSGFPQGSRPLVHSDQGFQYQHTSWRRLVHDAGATQSMSRKGNCFDNAVIENFFGHLKEECFHHVSYLNIDALTMALHEYIDWYNNHRTSETLEGLSPVQYRTQTLAA